MPPRRRLAAVFLTMLVALAATCSKPRQVEGDDQEPRRWQLDDHPARQGRPANG